jgi:hypothetical protein
LIIDSELADSNSVDWEVQKDLIMAGNILKLSIDSPHIYLLEGITSSFFKGVMPGSNTTYQNLNNIRFSAALLFLQLQ